MNQADIFDRVARRLRRQRAAQATTHWIHARIADEVLDRLGAIRRSFTNILIIGHDFNAIAPLLRAGGARVIICDPGAAADLLCDEDRLAIGDARFDLILSFATLDTVNDLPGALLLIRRALAPDGLFLGAMMGAGSLTTLRGLLSQIEPGCSRIHPQVDVRAAGDLLQRAGFALPVADSDPVIARYASFARLRDDLREHALTNVLRARPMLTRACATQLHADFAAAADPNGRTRENFVLLHLTGWAPAAVKG